MVLVVVVRGSIRGHVLIWFGSRSRHGGRHGAVVKEALIPGTIAFSLSLSL